MTQLIQKLVSKPMSVGETKTGSKNRARNILTKYPENDLGTGVEFGYEPIDEKYFMHCFATIVDKSGKVFSEQSSTLELPEVFLDTIKKGVNLDEVLDNLTAGLNTNERGRRFVDLIKKRIFIYESLNNVMLRYLFDDFYKIKK